MPNWCMNDVKLSHEDPEVFKQVVESLEKMEEYMLFRTLVPDYQYREAHEVDFSVEDDTIHLNFDSAWSPPEEVYEYLEEQGWSVWATYYEPGMEIAGIGEGSDLRQFDDIHSITEEDIESDPDLKETVEHWNIMEEIEQMREDEEEDDYVYE